MIKSNANRKCCFLVYFNLLMNFWFFKIISKVVEKVISDQLNKFFVKHKLLFDHQYGFRSWHSTEHAALELTDRIITNVDNKKSTKYPPWSLESFWHPRPQNITVEPRLTVTSPYGHLTITVTLAQSQIVFHSAKNRTFAPCNMVTSPLRPLLPSPASDLISEVPLY